MADNGLDREASREKGEIMCAVCDTQSWISKEKETAGRGNRAL